MSIKNSNLLEKIGFALIIVGFVFMILNDTWKDNPIPTLMEKNMYFSSIGLLLWAFGNMRREKESKD